MTDAVVGSVRARRFRHIPPSPCVTPRAAVLCAATRNVASIHRTIVSTHTSTAIPAVYRKDTAMPRLSKGSPSDTVEDTEDTEGHMPRMGRSAPSDTAQDTEGHARNRP